MVVDEILSEYTQCQVIIGHKCGPDEIQNSWGRKREWAKETKDIQRKSKKTWRIGFTEINIRICFKRRVGNSD